MTNQVENLILEHLKRFQAGPERIEAELKEIKARVTSLEIGQATIIQHLGHLSGVTAEQHVRYDRLVERIDRIEKRLEPVP